MTEADNLIFLGADTGNEISEVVVFTDQAYIKRTAKTSALKGLNRFHLEVLAYNVEAASAQGRIFGSGEILSVQYKEVPLKDAPQKEVKELDQKLEELQQQLKSLKSGQEVLAKQKCFLDSVIVFGETEVPKRIKTQFPTPEELEKMLNFLGDKFSGLAKKDKDLTIAIRELEKEIAVVQRKIKLAKRPSQHTRKVIEILFAADTAQTVDIEISYVVRNVSWEAVYKADIPADLAGVNLTMFARIQQNTGEDWHNISLSVSNAIPLAGAVLPELGSWRLCFPKAAMAQPFAMAAGSAMPVAAEEDLDQADSEELIEDMLEDAGPPVAQFVQAEQTELPLAFEYKLPQAIDIPTGGGESLLPLFTREISGEFYIYSVPAKDHLSYLVCNATADCQILAGTLNIHFGGRFVGSTRLNEKKAGQDLLMPLGAERQLKVNREKSTDKVVETFLGMVDRASVVRELEYRISLENLKEETVEVQLIDAVPVSETDRIQVKGIDMTPSPFMEDYQHQKGLMLWKMSLKPKQTREIIIKFFVKSPKGRKVSGI